MASGVGVSACEWRGGVYQCIKGGKGCAGLDFVLVWQCVGWGGEGYSVYAFVWAMYGVGWEEL